MFDRILEVLPEIGVAMGQTLTMLLVAIPLAVLLGTPLGVLLYTIGPNGLKHRPRLHRVLDGLVNLIRSFPFLILLIAIIPVTRFIVGTTIGTAAVIVPLTINAIPYFARFVEQNLSQLGSGVVEAARSMGASRSQIVRDVLIVEAKPGLVSSITIMTVSFISYSAMAGLVGGGGIGDFAIRYGYYRYETAADDHRHSADDPPGHHRPAGRILHRPAPGQARSDACAAPAHHPTPTAERPHDFNTQYPLRRTPPPSADQRVRDEHVQPHHGRPVAAPRGAAAPLQRTSALDRPGPPARGRQV